jgi:hypothetical protein
MSRHCLAILFLLSAAAPWPLSAQQDDPSAGGGVAAVKGTWEGPWYRGMTSGKVKIQIEDAGGTIQFTNLDNFGSGPHPISDSGFDGETFKFRTQGDKGGPLTASLKRNESGNEMKGLGKFDGFPLRFEIKRAAP